MVRQSDLNALAAFVEAGADVTSLEEFPGYVVEGLPPLVPCDSISYNEVDPDPPRLVSVLEPASLRFDGDTELWARYMHQHPVVARYLETRDGRAFTISDFLDRGEYRRLELYGQLYRLLRTEFQIAVCLPSPPPLVVGVALNRERRDFSERDRAVLNLARLHLAQVYASAEARARLEGSLAALQRAAESDGEAVVLLDRSGRIELASERARLALAEHFGHAGAELPAPLAAWVARTRSAPPTSLEPPPPAEPLILTGARKGRLVVRFLPGLERGEPDALVLDEPRRVRAAGLTAREAEVLRHVADGLTNTEVAAALGVSRRTVEKHLERAYAKLRVENRTAAAAKAFGQTR
jgi:DNA-binding CsgD family transcriptional regulator/PAS domain-containing protein